MNGNIIIEQNDWDIVCPGKQKGKPPQNKGFKLYYDLVAKHREHYQNSNDRETRWIIIKTILNELSNHEPPCHFIKPITIREKI